MKKVLIVFGTRPEAIKMCPLILALQNQPNIEVKICTTGQHKDMIDSILHFFHIVPNYNFSIMQKRHTLEDITCSILEELSSILKSEQFDLILVHGDTSTTFACALTAFYHRIPVGHVEAGLRTHNIYSPYPEEFNRSAVSIISDLNFAPTKMAAQNLLNEGKSRDSIFITGNTVIDAMRYTIQKHYYHPELEWAADSRLILLTAHRRENWGEALYNIFYAVKELVHRVQDIKIICPMHPNPLVRKPAHQILDNEKNVHLIEPLDVVDFHNFMNCAFLILTDSGGIQEEAPFLHKPVLVLRNTTERPEGIEAGTLKIVGTDSANIIAKVEQLLSDEALYKKMCDAVNPYGDGHASERITQVVCDFLEEKP